jgi:TonB family protein
MKASDSDKSPSSAVPVSFVLTDNSGRYRLENLMPGRYYVMADVTPRLTFYPGVSSLNEATAVNVSANITTIDVTITAPTGVVVSGRVIRPATQTPTGNQRVFLSGSSSQNTSINADGSFTFLNVRPGSYNLTISSATLSQPISIVVADKDIMGIEAVIVPTMDVTGTVVVDGGGPRPRLTVSFSAFKGGTPPPAAVTPDGTFRTVLREGEYQLAWSGLPSGYQLKSATAGSLDLLKNPLKITVGTPTPPIVLTLGVDSPPPWVKVSGRVTGLSRQIVGPRLTLSGAFLPDVPDTAIDANGSFEFPRVLPGTYTARMTPAIPVPATTVVVPSGKDLSGIEIIIPALKELTGRIVVEGPSQMAPRLTFNLSEPSGRASPLGNLSSVGIPQPDGTFKVMLPEAEHRVSLNAAGYSVRSLTYGSTNLLRDPLKISGTDSQELQVTLVPLPPGSSPGVVGGVLTGVLGGVLRAEVGTAVPPSPPPPPPAPPPPPSSPRVRVGGSVIAANLLSQVKPVYPPLAKEAGIQGVVVLEAEISQEGAVEGLKVISGHPLLIQSAIDAVKQWRYKPVMLDNKAVPVVTTITVNFAFSSAPPVPQGALTGPEPVSPPNDAVFDSFPRTTLLVWKPVEGAASYTVEIDCFHCCAANQWCTDLGQPTRIEANISEPKFSFDFVGAQPGRWRVWAVSAEGKESPKSAWSQFRYTR